MMPCCWCKRRSFRIVWSNPLLSPNTRVYSLSLKRETSPAKLSSRFFSSTDHSRRSLGGRTVRIGHVETKIGGGTARAPHLVPTGYLFHDKLSETTTREQNVLRHLQWMMAKDTLEQDMLLVGPPGAGSVFRRELVHMYAELTGREMEVLTLSADTTESDLKQRRELITGHDGHHEVVFMDQAPVRAALHGRLLVLDGIHNAERNVLPALNNLLENREMNLEDGRLLVSHRRYEQLFGNEVDKSTFIVPVHEDFRVIALGIPAPPYPGNSLDPPLRSRFQIRRVDNPSSQELYEDLILHGSVSEATAKLCAKMGGAMETLQQEAAESFEFPLNALRSSAKTLETFGAENPISIFMRMYPFWYDKKEAEKTMARGGRLGHSAELFRRVASEFLPESSTASILPSSYSIQNVEKDALHSISASVTFSGPKSSPNNDVVLQHTPCGTGPIRPTDPQFVVTPSRAAVLAAMIQEHNSGRDLLLISPKGEGKTALATQFSNMLGYGDDLEIFSLHKDMSSLDLLVRRSGSSNKGKVGSGWAESPLLRAAMKGQVCILDGIDKLTPGCIGTIQSLLTQREIHLPDGRIVTGRKSTQQEGECVSVHPSFRVIALATTESGQMRFLTDEVLAMFSTITVPSLSDSELQSIFDQRAPECPENVRKSILALHSQLDESVASDCGVSTMSLRNLVRVMKQVDPQTVSSKSGDLHHLLCSLFVTDLLLPNQRRTFMSFLESVGIRPQIDTNQSRNGLAIEYSERSLKIGDFSMQRNTGGRHEMIPNPHFVDIPSHVSMIRDLLHEWAHGERSFFICGNQGIGKNKLVDRVCQVAGFEREYIQLHRDSTVGQLTMTPFLEDGKLKWKDSPLIRAVIEGSSIIIDEADKAPLEVVCLLKNLLEDKELALPDGRRISRQASDREGTIQIHPNFTAWVLANRPGYPFHGNDLFREVGDCFSSHVIPNPDFHSEVELLSSYAPSVDIQVIERIAASFAELRNLSDIGELQYPYSTREAVAVVRHLERYPNDRIEYVLGNILDIDSYDPFTFELLLEAFDKHGIKVDGLREIYRAHGHCHGFSEQRLSIFYPERKEEDGESGRPPSLSSPKIGKWDDKNEAHVGGNQWAGGTGGSDTAGLGGRGGPFRLDRGHRVHQVSDEAKAEVSDEAAAAARKIAQEALHDRLREIGMSETEWHRYEEFLKPIEKDIDTLKRTLRSVQSREAERVWLKNQTHGEIDDSKLVDGAAGEKYIFKRRGIEEDKRDSTGPRQMRFVLDCSGSMYRFNGYDGRLQRGLEVAALIMESFSGMQDRFEYTIVGHSGDSKKIPLVSNGSYPQNAKERMRILSTMIAHTQFCQSGDNTLPALKQAVADSVYEGDPGFQSTKPIVVLVSDANLSRYGIHPKELARAVKKGDNDNVKAYCVFIGSLGHEAEEIKQALPAGRGFTCMDTSELPKIVQSILVQHLE